MSDFVDNVNHRLGIFGQDLADSTGPVEAPKIEPKANVVCANCGRKLALCRLEQRYDGKRIFLFCPRCRKAFEFAKTETMIVWVLPRVLDRQDIVNAGLPSSSIKMKHVFDIQDKTPIGMILIFPSELVDQVAQAVLQNQWLCAKTGKKG